MKLKYIPKHQEQVKFSFKLAEDDAKLLEEYKQYFFNETGSEIANEDLVESIVKTFLLEDKKFLLWKKSNIKKGNYLDTSNEKT